MLNISSRESNIVEQKGRLRLQADIVLGCWYGMQLVVDSLLDQLIPRLFPLCHFALEAPQPKILRVR
jgi:hypothetical protein